MEENKPKFFDFNVIESESEEKKETEEVKTTDSDIKKVNFNDVFNVGIKNTETHTTEEVVTDSNKFFDTTKKIEIVEVVPEEVEDSSEEIGNAPMIDYDRINSSYLASEEVVEKKEEDTSIAQANNNLNVNKINVSGSDLMKLRMQRK